MKSIQFLLSVLILGISISCSSDSDTPQIEMPVLSVQNISVTEGSAEKPIFVDFRLDNSTDVEVRFTVSTESGTAISGEDFIQVDPQELTIRPTSTRESLRIVILGDSQPELDEVFYIIISDVQGATSLESRIEITIENDDTFNNYEIPDLGYSTPSEYPGMTKIWSDEFDGNALNQDYWTHEIGNGRSGWGNRELQFYRSENTDLHEGHLVIQAREENFGGFQYTSSRMITKNKFEFTHGRVDIRAALPYGQGIWPAFWMLGANFSEVGWPECGEIDIMEMVGHEPSTLHGTVHYPDQNGNHLFMGSSTRLSNGIRFADRFHVFSIIWSEDKIEWYLDDVKYYTVTPTILGSGNPYPFNEPFFFIFNIAVGGRWPGSPDATTTFPQNMFVDYIRVFQ